MKKYSHYIAYRRCCCRPRLLKVPLFFMEGKLKSVYLGFLTYQRSRGTATKVASLKTTNNGANSNQKPDSS